MEPARAAAPGSCDQLPLHHVLDRRIVAAAGEGEKGLLRRGALAEIGLEQALDDLGHLRRLDVAIDLARERGVRPEAAADQDVVALDRLAILGLLHLAG